jgi:hypothetical protein
MAVTRVSITTARRAKAPAVLKPLRMSMLGSSCDSVNAK